MVNYFSPDQFFFEDWIRIRLFSLVGSGSTAPESVALPRSCSLGGEEGCEGKAGSLFKLVTLHRLTENMS